MAGPVPTPCLRAVLRGDPCPPLPPEIARVEVVPIGSLALPSGRVVACDPGVLDDTPFDRPVPAGTYPVRLYVAHFRAGDQRVAAAELVLGDEPPEGWEHAVTPGHDATPIRPERVFAYGVDSGTGCFMDLHAARALAATVGGRDAFYDRTYAVMESTYAHTRSWAVVGVDGGPGHDVAAFSSGMGDGAYGSYWGLRGGRPVRLVTDFGLLPTGDEDADETEVQGEGEGVEAEPEPVADSDPELPDLDHDFAVDKGAAKRWWKFWK